MLWQAERNCATTLSLFYFYLLKHFMKTWSRTGWMLWCEEELLCFHTPCFQAWLLIWAQLPLEPLINARYKQPMDSLMNIQTWLLHIIPYAVLEHSGGFRASLSYCICVCLNERRFDRETRILKCDIILVSM